VPIPVPVQLSYLAGSFNWLCLGVFTGCRLAEYGPGKMAKGQRYNVAPHPCWMPATGRALLWRLFELISRYMIAATVAFTMDDCGTVEWVQPHSVEV
jgi:hypothetical protein